MAFGCERDDICPESTPTTPRLIIRFYDIGNSNETKNVRQLSVHGEGIDTDIIPNSNTDSIVLPLRIESEEVVTVSRFILKRDSDFDTDNDDTTISNSDTIEVSYSTQFVYVSRACGYKSIFNDLQITRENDADTWIFSTETTNTTIENEDAAHISIFH